MAGYNNPHFVPGPYSFVCIAHVPDSVQMMIKRLFKVDVDAIKCDGRLAPLIATAAAQAGCAYNELRRECGANNGIVQCI